MAKVVSKIAVIGAGVAILASAGFALRQNSAPRASATPALVKTQSTSTAGAAVSATRSADYKPSRFPGVQVRHVPQSQTVSAAPGAAQESWIGKRPGTARPAEGIVLPSVAGRAPGQGLRTGQGTTRFGGTWVEVPRSRVPLSVGRRDAQRKAVVQCKEPHDH